MTIKVSRCVQELGVDTSVVQFVQNDTSFGVLGVLGVFIKVGSPGWPEVFWWNAIDFWGFQIPTPWLRDQEAWVEPSEDLMADNCAMESFSTRTCWVRLCLKPACGCFHYPWFSTRSLTCDVSIHIQHFRVHQPNLTWQMKVILQTQLCQGQLPITLIFEFVHSAGWSKPHMKSLPQTATPHIDIVWRGCPWIFRLGNNHKYIRPLYWLDW